MTSGDSKTNGNAVSDAISAAAATSGSDKTQTRFSFYDAREVQLQYSENKEEPKAPAAVSTPSSSSSRFNHLHNNTTSASSFSSTRAVEARQELAAVDDNIQPNHSNSTDATDEILRSLQETEEQRMKILKVAPKRPSDSGIRPQDVASSVLPSPIMTSNMDKEMDDDDGSRNSNPYEDAIKEALTLLRKHRSPAGTPAGTPSHSNPVTNETSPPVALDPTRPRTPREQDRLLQHRGVDELDGHDGNVAGEVTGVASPQSTEELIDGYESAKMKARQRQERMAQYATRLREFKSSLPQETKDAFHISNSSSGIGSVVKENPTDESMNISVNLSPASKQREEEVQRGVERVLLAMLEQANVSRERAKQVVSSHVQPSSGQEESGVSDGLVRAMQELLGQADEKKCRVRDDESVATGIASKRYAAQNSVVDELLAEDDGDATVRTLETTTSTGVAMNGRPHWQEEKKWPDSRRQEIIQEEGVRDSQDVSTMLEDDEVDDYDGIDDSTHDNEDLGNVLGPLSKKAGGTTGVVLDIENEDSASEESGAGSTNFAPFSSVMSYVTNRYAVNDDMEGTDVDMEANEIMRTLCSHLLPFGVEQSKELLEAIPTWDETNSNEYGYRIIRLSKSKLRRVESAFENMIIGFKAKSQSQLNGLDAAAINGYDANFAKDLQEAERALDDEEKRLKATNKTATPRVETYDANPFYEESSEAPSLECHPDFPGIHQTGKGEMGDLEYFHLPIIFKSHVTGFEPTKDLVLEPGNVIAGQYLVESELGSAAFSTAYRCVDLSSESADGPEEVCLKVIKNTKDFFDQSLDEIKILELLRQTGQCHRNHILVMKTFFYYREHLVIVTELLRQNLFEFGKFILDNNEEQYFTIPRLAYITRQALISLRFVHSLGLVHSDVKPENILLSSYSRAQIKLIDFGSSCFLTDRQSSYIQSRSYRAPEVVLGLPYDGKIDVWSMGCVVAEMFTGEVTFQNDSIVSMLSRIEAICGTFPRHMIAQGRQSGRYFTKSGLLYEVVGDSDRDRQKTAPGPQDEDSEGDVDIQFDIFQPKRTRISARLGFDIDLMDDLTTKQKDPKLQLQIMFTDFVSRVLTIDPDSRPTAEEALRHPFMQYAATLTEEQIKYPSS